MQKKKKKLTQVTHRWFLLLVTKFPQLTQRLIAKLIWDEASAKRKEKLSTKREKKTQYIMGRIEEGELAHVCLKISFMEEGKERMEFSEKLMGISACLRGESSIGKGIKGRQVQNAIGG